MLDEAGNKKNIDRLGMCFRICICYPLYQL